MKVSREVAAENRERVLETAGEQFRAQGYDGIGVASLMKAAGLTHGGFYKQFESKEALVREATERALARNHEGWRDALDGAAGGGGEAIARLKAWYLSPPHVAARDRGCAFAALAAEAPRHGPELRQTFEAALRRTVDLLVDEGGLDRAEAIRTAAQMVGALMLARAVEDPALSAEILEAGRGAQPEGSS